MTPRLLAGAALAAALAAWSLGCSADGGAVAAPGGVGGAGVGGLTGTGGLVPAGTGGVVPGAGGSAPVGAGGDPGTGGAPVGPVPIPGNTATLPFAGYDPNVAFDWVETTPSIGSCKAGHYTGGFTGKYLSPAAIFLQVDVSGNVDLQLAESQNGEFFEIANGKLSGVANGLFPFSGDLTGSLNCTTRKLENAIMTNGTYNAFGVNYFFEGPLTADYDKLANAFVNGTWQVGEPTFTNPPPPYGGAGVWGVNYVGP